MLHCHITLQAGVPESLLPFSVFLRFFLGLFTVFPWSFYGFPLVFLRFSHGLFTVFHALFPVLHGLSLLALSFLFFTFHLREQKTK